MSRERQRFDVNELRGTLEGRLTALEPLAPAHERDLVEAAQDGELFTWFPTDLRGAVAEWIAGAVGASEQGREVPFAIVAKASGKAVGSTRFLELRPEHLRAEIGFTWLAHSTWGTGINVEGKLLLLTRAFEAAGLRRVEFKTDARNERSRGALEALGARFEGVLRKHMVIRDGGARDSAYYSVIDDEWPRVKALLERRLERHLPASS